MTDIPQTAADFEKWFDANKADWPADLQTKGTRALLTLKSMRGKNFGRLCT